MGKARQVRQTPPSLFLHEIRSKKAFFSGSLPIRLEVENMDKTKRNEQKSKDSKTPIVTMSFAETEDDTLIDTVLGMLLQSFSK